MMKKVLLLIIPLFLTTVSIADNGNWNIGYKTEKVFIENKGQFSPVLQMPSPQLQSCGQLVGDSVASQ